jgi:hypothetical protein
MTPVLPVTVAASLTLLGLAVRAARRPDRPKLAEAAAVAHGIGLLFGGLFQSPAVLFQVIGTAVVWSATGFAGRRWRPALAAAACVAGWAAVAPQVIGHHRRLVELRDRHPFEPLAARLPVAAPAPAPAFDPLALVRTEGEIDRQLSGPGDGRRRWALTRLHEEKLALFASNPGFGRLRMLPLQPGEFMLGDRRGPVASFWLDRAGDHRTAADLHREAVADFAYPEGFGLVRDGTVAGFQSHGLSAVSAAVERIDLIGLVLAAEPRVYVTESLPRMDELRAAATRPPDPFEAAALARLGAGEELVSGAAGRLVGAVRAGRQCLDCHAGERGRLLGAFSYRLRPPGSAVAPRP